MIFSGGVYIGAELGSESVISSGSRGPFLATPLDDVVVEHANGVDKWLHAHYAEMYRRHNWVYTVVDYRANAIARLPLKVFRRGERGRVEARDSAYAALLRDPSPHYDANLFWRTVSMHLDLFGEAILIKTRDSDGTVGELNPVLPLHIETVIKGGDLKYRFVSAQGVGLIDAEDVVHIRTANPFGQHRGLSPLEPLRRTLENEEAARLAQQSFWHRGARPGMALKHPGQLSAPAQQRLKAQFDGIAAGAGNTGSTVVLEEGMEAQPLGLSAEEAQYIQTRELNAVEVIAAYHLPPTAVGILTHATYSNVTEQLRSVYRDTVAPMLTMLEAALDKQLRPDFDTTGEVYAEFLLDEVLRGSFEDRVSALATAINSGQITIAEARAIENREFKDGSDSLYINSASVPLAVPDEDGVAVPAELAYQKVGLPALVAAGIVSPAWAAEQMGAPTAGLSTVPQVQAVDVAPITTEEAT